MPTKDQILKELQRRANDRLKVFNPLTIDFTITYDGFRHTVRSYQEKILSRDIAENYIKHMIDRLINDENDRKVKAENVRRKKSGQKDMDPQERLTFDLRTSDPKLRKKYITYVYKGVTEYYGKEEKEEPDKKDKRPTDEVLMEEMEKQFVKETPPEVKEEKPNTAKEELIKEVHDESQN